MSTLFILRRYGAVKIINHTKGLQSHRCITYWVVPVLNYLEILLEN